MFKDDSGAFVQISSKTTDLPERVVTIEGDFEKRKKALSMVVRKISEDPQHSSIPSLDYSRFSNSESNERESSRGGGGGGSSSLGVQSIGGGAKGDFNAAATYLGANPFFKSLILIISIINLY